MVTWLLSKFGSESWDGLRVMGRSDCFIRGAVGLASLCV